MYEDTEKFVDIDFEQSVRKAAYHLWENDGRPFGKEKDYWFLAIEQLMQERSEANGKTASGAKAPLAAK